MRHRQRPRRGRAPARSWLTWALILEEGLEGALLRTFVAGAARAAAEAGVAIVAGDTKVVPRGKGDRAFVVTAGLGVVPPGRDLGDHRIAPGDAVARLRSDRRPRRDDRWPAATGSAARGCAPTARRCASLVEALLAAGVDVHAMHDPTRGGVATTCNEVAARAGVRIVLDEAAVPVRPQVRGGVRRARARPALRRVRGAACCSSPTATPSGRWRR